MRYPRAALTAALLIACSSAHAQAQTKIAFGYTAVAEYAAAFIAKDEGYFARHGLDVTLTQVSLNSLMPTALVSNSLQLAVPTAPILLQANDAGLDLVILGSSSVINRTGDNVGIVGRSGAPIAAPQDFDGKKVGVPGLNALLHVLFREWLTMQGVDHRKVVFIETSFPQMSDALKAGQIDAVVAVDPFYHRILAAGTGKLFRAFYKDLPPGIVTSFYATTRAWADAHPDAVKGVQAALGEAVVFHRQHPDAWRPLVAKYTKLPPEVMATLASPNLELTVTPQQIDQWADIMTGQGMVRTRPDATTLIVR